MKKEHRLRARGKLTELLVTDKNTPRPSIVAGGRPAGLGSLAVKRNHVRTCPDSPPPAFLGGRPRDTQPAYPGSPLRLVDGLVEKTSLFLGGGSRAFCLHDLLSSRLPARAGTLVAKTGSGSFPTNENTERPKWEGMESSSTAGIVKWSMCVWTSGPRTGAS